jgi:hypothetical protein
LSLAKTISLAKIIHDKDRQSPIDRIVAAKHIGYTSLSGASEKVLACLSHYGLAERTGKGELRISDLAVDILHPHTQQDKRQALLQAAFRPRIFAELRERFNGTASEHAIESYLKRESFLDRAIAPVTKAYLDNYHLLEQEKAFESDGKRASTGGESAPDDHDGTDEMEDALTLERPTKAAAAPSAAVAIESGEAEWMRNPLGRDTAVRLLVTGKMGGKELGKLIKLLEAQKAILDDDEEDDFDKL